MDKLIFKKIRLDLDPNKKCIVVFENGDPEKYTHTYGCSRTITKKIADQFNIIHITTTGNAKEKNLYSLNVKFLHELYRKKDHSNYIEENNKMISESLKSSFIDIPELEYIIIGNADNFILPLGSYCNKNTSIELNENRNEFFDSLTADNLIEEINKSVVNNYWDTKNSPIAFSTCKTNIFPHAVKVLSKRLKNDCMTFVIDPTMYTPYFRLNKIPLRSYYFADDKRGTRNFNKFPIAQIQHMVYEKEKIWSPLEDQFISAEKKTKNLLFYGTVFHTKGDKIETWNEFLKDFRDPDSKLFIPVKTNVATKSPSHSKKTDAERVKDLFPETYSEVVNHPNVSTKPMYPYDINNVSMDYKYSLILRCVSSTESLNFRPVLCSFLNMLPFIDYKYDPENLQIPKEIRNELVVKNRLDIENKIRYYNTNDKERLEMIKELRALFNIDGWLNNSDQMLREAIQSVIKEYK